MPLSPKFARLMDVGSVVTDICGRSFRVVSKISTSDGLTFKLASLQGEPVPTPADFHPVNPTIARFASLLRILSYNKDLTKIVNSMIEQHGFPTDPRMNWSAYVQTAMAPALAAVSPDFDLQDEAIYQVIVRALLDRDILADFPKAIKKFPKGVRELPIERQVSEYLKKAFVWRIQEAKKYMQTVQPAEEMSLEQPAHDTESGESYSLLNEEEHATGTEDYADADAERDFKAFREEFYKWLVNKNKASAFGFATLLTIYWEQVQQAEGELKFGDLTQEWLRRSHLGFDSLKAYNTKLPQVLKEFVQSNVGVMKGKYELMDLINFLLPKKKEKARPAKASSLKTADGVEGDIAQAKSETDSTGTIDPDIKAALGISVPMEKFASPPPPPPPAYVQEAPAARHPAPPTGSPQVVAPEGMQDIYIPHVEHPDRVQDELMRKQLEQEQKECRERLTSVASAKPKCPHCGSDDYGLMPTDFETAKCNNCGKNWEHGIVKGINDPKEASESGDLLEAQTLGQCECEWEDCPAAHRGQCPNPATVATDFNGHRSNLCKRCYLNVVDFLRAEHGTDDLSLTGFSVISGFEKEGMIGHDFVDADQQAIRPDITPGDTGRVPHGRTQGSEKPKCNCGTAQSGADTHESWCNVNQHPREEHDLTAAVPAGTLDIEQPTGVPTENWQCLNCGHEGMLSQHGKCEACGSDAVASMLPAPPEYARYGIDPKSGRSLQVLECCGSVTGHHKMDCPVYTKNFDETIAKLPELQRRREQKDAAATGVAPARSREVWKVTLRDAKGNLREQGVGGETPRAAERAVQKYVKSGENIVSVKIAAPAAAPAPAQAPAAAPAAPPVAPPSVVAPPLGTPLALQQQQQTEEPMRKTVPPEIPNRKYHMTSRVLTMAEMKTNSSTQASAEKEAATPAEAINAMPQRGKPKSPDQLGLKKRQQEVGYVPDSAIASVKEATMEKKAAQPTSGSVGSDGFVNIEYTQYGIRMSPGEDLQQIVEAEGPDYISREHVDIYQMLEGYLTNGWEIVNPEDIGALTSGEIISDPNGNVYWHERYQIEDAAEELYKGNTVDWKYGGNLYENEGEIAPPAEIESSVKEAAPEVQEQQADFEVSNQGSIFLLTPVTALAEDWVIENLGSEVQTYGDSIVVEHRYIGDIVEGIRNDGLKVAE